MNAGVRRSTRKVAVTRKGRSGSFGHVNVFLQVTGQKIVLKPCQFPNSIAMYGDAWQRSRCHQNMHIRNLTPGCKRLQRKLY